MRRLTDVIISSDDRPSPPRGHVSRAGSARKAAAEKAPPIKTETARRPRRRRAPSPLRRRVRSLAIGVALVAVLGAGSVWAVRSLAFSKARSAATTELTALSRTIGLRVDRVVIDGRKRVPESDVATALGIDLGEATLGIDLASAQARIAALQGVKSVTIERHLPGEIHVQIVERQPIAIWQNDGRYQLVDADGLAAGDNIDDYPGLPLVVGPGAPGHAAELLAMIAAEKDLAGRVKASQWISGQRWNIEMSGPEGDIEVRLPEEDPATAWHDLAKIEAENKLLERRITMIDMRLPDRLVLRVPSGVEQTEKTIPNPAARHKAPGRDA